VSDFDAIVVGSGISGGWVAKELCERGLKVLVLERGKPTDPAKDYTDMQEPWERKHLNKVSDEVMKRDFFLMGNYYALKESNRHFWMTDRDQPYERAPGQSFRWRRGNQVGGKSLMWARASYRFAPYDFEVNKQDGEGVDWPVRYDDIAPWYDKVEKFIGVAGDRDGVEQLPDGEHFLPAFSHTCVETDLKAKLETTHPERKLIMGRVANLTRLTEEQRALGRGECQARNNCFYGCSYGAYFSSVSATLPAAKRTGNLTLIPNAIVTKLVHDPVSNRVTAVEVLDAETRATSSHTAKMVFMNASTIGTTLILLNSSTAEHPNGLANSSGQLGKNLMDHLGGSTVGATVSGYDDKYFSGRRPIGGYIPRYRNFPNHVEDYKRAWGFQVYSWRGSWGGNRPGIGADFKASNRSPGSWTIMLDAFGECIPREANRVTAHKTKTDKWGQPIAAIDFSLGKNDEKIMRAAHADAKQMLEGAGYTGIYAANKPDDHLNGVAGRLHEMGTARMGHDAKTSVLNGWNQSHDIPNLFITDGSFMTSSACQNPSLTYMAFSARAANHAADLLAEGAL
jgi:choline dehydrogenase-like flavoprotein